jgi:hypothetical protein
LRESLDVGEVLTTAAREISGALGLAAVDVRLSTDWYGEDDAAARDGGSEVLEPDNLPK